jgi:hypothetical protein
MTNGSKATYCATFLAAVLLLSIASTATLFQRAEATPNASSGLDEIWTQQFGTGDNEGDINAATHSSGVYVSGFTAGTFPSQSNAGDTDAFIKKFDHDGNELWVVQFGTADGDSARAIAVDETGVYAAGPGIGIYKFDHNGNELWNDVIENVTIVDVSVDESGVYIVGNKEVNLPGATPAGPDDWTAGDIILPLFLKKYDPTTGDEVYAVQWGIGSAELAEEFGARPSVSGVDSFSGAAYVVGQTWPPDAASAHHGEIDAYVSKFDASGNLLWTQFLDYGGKDGATDVDAGSEGIFVAGIGGTQPGAAIGTGFAFLTKLDEDGNHVFSETLAALGEFVVSSFTGVAVNDGGVYVTGSAQEQDPYTTIPSQFFLKKYDYDGNEILSIDLPAFPTKVATGSPGVYVAGVTSEALPGQTHSGGVDAYLQKYMASTVAQVTLTIDSVTMSGQALPGMWTTIRDDSGALVMTGFTPLTFTGMSGNDYRVSVANYDGKTFTKWQDDDSTSKSRIVNLTSDTTLTAIYDTGDTLRGFTSLTYTGTDEMPDLTVNAVSLDGSKVLHMWTIIDPQSSDESGTTYKVYIHNYQDRIFDHWEDGGTDRIRMLTIEEATTITAYYQTG